MPIKKQRKEKSHTCAMSLPSQRVLKAVSVANLSTKRSNIIILCGRRFRDEEGLNFKCETFI